MVSWYKWSNIVYYSQKELSFHYLQSFFPIELEDTTLALDFRVTILEENGGSDGNSSVAALEVRVEALEGTAVDHETRISATESDVAGRWGIIAVFNKSCQMQLGDYIIKFSFHSPL